MEAREVDKKGMPSFLTAGPSDFLGHLGMPTAGSQLGQKAYALRPFYRELFRFSPVLTFIPVVMQFAAPIRVAAPAMKNALL